MNIAIILSGGVGSRMGTDIPKQYIELNGKPIIWYCLKTFIENPYVDLIIIGRAKEWGDYIKDLVDGINTSKPVYYADPGETRQFSIYNSLLVAQEIGANYNDVVIIHDAARPLVSHDLINCCIDSFKEKDVEAVLPVVPVKDTLYQSKDGRQITCLLNRSELFAGQAPEAFAFGKYLELHERMSKEEILKINGSTEIAYKGGMKVKLVKGEEKNFKITTPEDLSNFSIYLDQKC